MMFLTITSRISNSFLACFGKQQKPFKELSLSQEAVRKIAEDIFEKGYASIPWSEATEAFFQNYQNEAGFAVTKKSDNSTASYHFSENTVKTNCFVSQTQQAQASKKINNANTTFNNFAKSLLKELFAMALPEKADEVFNANFFNQLGSGFTVHVCEIRECNQPRSESWHKDRLPNLLVLLSTIKGEDTDFVEPKAYQDLYPTTQIQKENFSEINKLPKHKLPKKHFNIFLTMHFIEALNELREKFPTAKIQNPAVLVHKAPGTPNRVIFLARFKVPNIMGKIKNLKITQ